MSILRDFEKRLEGAVEGAFARAFRSYLQPVELAKALQRYASNYQQVGLDGVLIPNVYRFQVSPEDHQRLSGFSTSLKRELAEVVTRTAQDRGWRLQGPVRIELIEGDQVRTGRYELRGKVDDPESMAAAAAASAAAAAAPSAAGAVAQSRPEEGATRVLATSAPTATLVGADGRRHTVSGTATIGRLPECEVTLDDPAVSRRHARLAHNGSGYTVEDLGSTNGVRLNGEPVTRAVPLRDGDRLDLGGVRVTFAMGR